LWSSSQEAWLRGYGLTAHPNLLGGMMAVLLLVLLAQWRRHQSWQQVILAAGLAVGSLGLLVSFSRTGWLAFVSGLLFWAWSSGERSKSLWPPRAVWLPLLTVPLFLLLYHDLVFNRWFHLGTLIEARSIQERVRDAQVALQLIAAQPWIGVGAGNALEAAQALRADATVVHNVPLLVMVELGLLGGICWLLFMLLPLWPFLSSKLLRRLATNDFAARPHRSRTPLYGALWIGLLVAGFFDTPLWLTTSWRAALLLGLLAALQAQRSDGAGDGRKEEAR
jgi:O-antigen ligase